MEDATTLEIRVRPCTTEAAVSSQVDSMPSTIGPLIAAPFAALLAVPFGCSVYCSAAAKPTILGSRSRLMVYASMPSGW